MCIQTKTDETKDELVEETVIQEDILQSIAETTNTFGALNIIISSKKYGEPMKQIQITM